RAARARLRGERPRQSRERVEVERLGPRARRHLGTRKRALEVDAAAAGESGEGVAQHLPALSEGGSDHLTEALLVAEVDTRRDAPADVEHRRLDARRRKEAAAGYAERQADVREGSEENRRHAVVPGARPRDEPLRDLALDHDDRLRHAGALLAQPEEDRDRDVVGKVADHRDARLGDQRLQGQRQHVTFDHPHARVLGIARGEASGERGVDLDEIEASRASGELVGERAEPGTDLEGDRARPDLGGLDDAVGHGGVAQEMLAPSLPRPDPGDGERLARLPPRAHQAGAPKGRSASAPMERPSSSPASSRRQPAMAIMAPLSVQNWKRGKTTSTPCSAPASAMRVRSRRFAETPPETTRRGTPVSTIASMVGATSMSTSASWTLAARRGSAPGAGGSE